MTGVQTCALPIYSAGGEHIHFIVEDIRPSIDAGASAHWHTASPEEKSTVVDAVARRNVLRVVNTILKDSQAIRRLVYEGKIAVVGGLYDVATGEIDFLISQGVNVAGVVESNDRPDAGQATSPKTPV